MNVGEFGSCLRHSRGVNSLKDFPAPHEPGNLDRAPKAVGAALFISNGVEVYVAPNT